MRSLPFLILTTAYFGVAFASYSQVSAEDRTETGPAGQTCKVVSADEARTMDLGNGLSSSVTVGNGAGSASTTVGGTTGSVTSTTGSGVSVQSSGGGSSASTMTTADGRTVITTSGGTCIIIDR